MAKALVIEQRRPAQQRHDEKSLSRSQSVAFWNCTPPHKLYVSTCGRTFNQWHDLGCSVQRRPDHVEAGNWGCGLAVYIPITKKADEPAKDGDEDEEDVFWILKKFTVFNADQVNGRARRRVSGR